MLETIREATLSQGNFYYEAGEGSQNFQFNNNIIDAPQGCGMNYLLSSLDYGNVFFTNNSFITSLASSYFSNYTYVNNFFINSDTNHIVPSVGLNGSNHHNVTNTSNLFGSNSQNFQKTIKTIFS